MPAKVCQLLAYIRFADPSECMQQMLVGFVNGSVLELDHSSLHWRRLLGLLAPVSLYTGVKHQTRSGICIFEYLPP
jgi:hypothetical protein